VPLAATVEASGLKLDAEIANVHVRRWLDAFEFATRSPATQQTNLA
jgi:hypothetical protein